MKKLTEYLEALGFSPIEAKLYLSLFASGPLTVQELAKAAKLNRTATYTYISSLLEKGVLIEVRTTTRKRFDAIKPDQLHYLIDNKMDKVRIMENQFPTFVQTINTTFSKNKSDEKASIKYYKGKDNLRAIYNDSFKAKELYSYVRLLEPNDPNRFFSDNLAIFTNAFKQNAQLRMKEIIYGSSNLELTYALAKNERYSFKLMPPNIQLSSQDILIYDGNVAIINYEEDIDAIVLQNMYYYRNSKELFDLLWQMLPEPSE